MDISPLNGNGNGRRRLVCHIVTMSLMRCAR